MIEQAASVSTTEDIVAIAKLLGIREQVMPHVIPGATMPDGEAVAFLSRLRLYDKAGPPPDDSGEWVLSVDDRWYLPPAEPVEPLTEGQLNEVFDWDDIGPPLRR